MSAHGGEIPGQRPILGAYLGLPGWHPQRGRTRASTLRGRQCSCAEACPSHPAWSSGRARRLQTHCVHGDSSHLWDVLWDARGASGHLDLAARQGTLAPSECPVSNEAARRISRVPPTGGLHGGCGADQLKPGSNGPDHRFGVAGSRRLSSLGRGVRGAHR
jgi:hypothetical protein